MELVEVVPAVDADRHRASDTSQFASAGIRDDGYVQRKDAFPHGPLVLQHEATPFALEDTGDELERDVGARSVDGSVGGQHVTFARGLQVAVKLLVEKEPAKRSGRGV